MNYWTQILPFVVLFALGMGAVFVPLTLTAVHHVRAEDSGIGSGVLNTMQQVGGALGLAILGTVASHATTAHIEEIAPGVAAGLQQADPSVLDQLMGVFGVGSFNELVGQVSYLGSFTAGRDGCLPGRRGPDARGLRGRLGVPRRQARGAGHRRSRGGGARRAEPTDETTRGRPRPPVGLIGPGGLVPDSRAVLRPGLAVGPSATREGTPCCPGPPG